MLRHYIVYRRIIECLANIHREGVFGRYIFPGSRFWPFNELPRYQDDPRIEHGWFLNGHPGDYPLPGFPSGGIVALDMEIPDRGMAELAWYAFPPDYQRLAR